MVKKKRTFPLLLLGMGIGLFIVVLGQTEFGVDVSGSFQTFEILQIETDPVTGEIIGQVTIGKPVQAGYAWTGAQKRTTCSFSVQSVQKNTDPSWSSGTSSGGCQFAFAEWDVSDLPDSFDATNLQLKLDVRKLLSISSVPQRTCKIGVIEQPVDTIAFGQESSKFYNPDLVLISGDWCQSLGVKTLQFGQAGAEAFERAVKGDDRFTISITHTTLAKGGGCCLTIPTSFWATAGSFVIDATAEPVSCPVGQKQEGFKCVVLDCGVGFQVSGNQCVQIQCNIGEELVGSICKPILCEVGDRLVGNTCEQIICPSGTLLIGSECQQILCDEGFTLSGNTCTVISCPVGNELVGSSCQQIICPLGTFLQGNNCVNIVCPIGNVLEGNDCALIECNVGENLIGNICKAVQCDIGQRLVGSFCENIVCESGTQLMGSECLPITCPITQELQGNQCVPKPLNCPSGTIENQNVCVQVIPQLQAGFDLGENALTIAGLLTFAIFATGFVAQRVRRTS